MTEKHSYANMADYLINMVDEAINSTMACMNFHGSTTTGFEGMVGGIEPVRISPLGGKYEGSSLVPGGQVTDPTTGGPATFTVLPEYGFPFHDLQGMVDYYNNQINALFDPWWQIPRPEDFTSQVQQAHKAAHLLAYRSTVAEQGKTATGPGVGMFAANPGLGAIDGIRERVSNLTGDALLTFEKNFTDPMAGVVNAQDAAACLAWMGVAGEQSIWVKVRDSLADVAANGVTAMKSARPDGGGGGISGLLTVLGAVSLIAGEFASGGLATPLVVAGVVAQTSSEFIPEHPKKEQPDLGASNPVGVIGKLGEALDQLKKSIRKEENWLSTRMQSMNGCIYGGQRGAFDLSEPALTHEDRKSQLYSAHEIQANYDVMDTVANTWMRDVADELTTAAKMLEDTGSGPWTRPGDIGLGATGPYDDWSGLNIAIKGVAQETARSINDAADALIILRKDFGKTDGQIKSDMDALAKKLASAKARASQQAH